MAQSSDEIIKREIKDHVGNVGDLKLVVFPQSSNDDQKIFPEGLTFGVGGVSYGSCDACWIKENQKWKNPYNNEITSKKPIVALEGTDALNRGSSGNAQYQRFHHALGAVKCGLIGVYYLKRGKHKVRPDLYGMAYFASKVEKGKYLIINDLSELKELLSLIEDSQKLNQFIKRKMDSMQKIFQDNFAKIYKNWDNFAKDRSTVIKSNYVIKYSGRMKRNFTDSSQRAGHIAVGEMYLTKYFFPKKFFFYLWPKMIKGDIRYLDKHKKDDKEWIILRNEPNVKIITIDDLEGVPEKIRKDFIKIKDKPINKGPAKKIYGKGIKILYRGLAKGDISIKKEILDSIRSKKTISQSY